MSNNLNTIHLVGRIGQTPRCQYFESGSVLTKASLAVKRGTASNDQPDWFDIEIWGKIAEVAANYTQKGSQVEIVGEFKLDEWTDTTTGEYRCKPVIKVSRLELLGHAPQHQPPQPQAMSQSQAVVRQPQPQAQQPFNYGTF